MALSNSHEALLRNRHLARGRLALIGVSDPALLMQLETGGAEPPLAITEHAGVFQRLREQGGCEARFGYGATPAGWADTVVIFAPKARAALSLQLALAVSLLAPGGAIVLVGEKKEGIAGAVGQLRAMAPETVKVDSARHCQVWHGEPAGGGTFDESQWLSWHRVELAGITLEVAGLPGIFSAGRLDTGTAHLLESLERQPVSGPVLDFACGAGVIGAWMQARDPALGPVDGVDVQYQAVRCARETYDRAGAAGTIHALDGLDDSLGRYRTIVTNPPFHTGVRTDTAVTGRFLQAARNHLLPGGELRLVANRFLPYRSLLEAQFESCTLVNEDSRFCVYQARKRS